MGSKSKHINPLYHMGLPTNRIWQSAALNQQAEWFYIDWLLQISCSRFEWQNLPNSIDERFMEMTLNSRGLSTFFYDDDYNQFFATQATPSGKINMYQNPLKFQAFGSNGFHRMLYADQCVPIWNNYTRTPTAFAIYLYASKLADIDRTIQVNMENQKMPVFVVCDENQRLTVQNLLKQTYGNEPVIIGDTASLHGIDLGYVNANIPYIADKLLMDKYRIWSEFMLYLGIDNSPIDKAERVQSAEIESNDSQIEKSGSMFLDTRRFACEEINRKYDLEVWVDMRRDWSSENYWRLMALPSAIIKDGSYE